MSIGAMQVGTFLFGIKATGVILIGLTFGN